MRIQPLIVALVAVGAVAACDDALVTHVGTFGTTNAVVTGPLTLTVTPNVATLAVNQTLQLRTNSPDTINIEWTSLSPTIATVSQFGLVKGASPGIATVRARLFADTNNLAISTIQVWGVVVP